MFAFDRKPSPSAAPPAPKPAAPGLVRGPPANPLWTQLALSSRPQTGAPDQRGAALREGASLHTLALDNDVEQFLRQYPDAAYRAKELVKMAGSVPSGYAKVFIRMLLDRLSSAERADLAERFLARIEGSVRGFVESPGGDEIFEMFRGALGSAPPTAPAQAEPSADGRAPEPARLTLEQRDLQERRALAQRAAVRGEEKRKEIHLRQWPELLKPAGQSATVNVGSGTPELAYRGGVARGSETQSLVQQEIILRIRASRGSIQQRLVRFVTAKDQPGGYLATVSEDLRLKAELGSSTPSESAKRTASRHPELESSAAASERYLDWLRKAIPTRVRESTSDALTLMQWKVFRKLMSWEGLPSDVNAFDTANVTWGAGFATSGKGTGLPGLMNRLFQKDPTMRTAFLEAGVTLDSDGKTFLVVDTEKGWVLRGADAERAIRADSVLISLLVNAGQGELGPTAAGNGVDHRQTVLDANFETFLAGAGGGIPAGGDVYALALAAHAIHFAPGWFSWSGLLRHLGNSELLKAEIRRVSVAKTGSEDQANLVIVAEGDDKVGLGKYAPMH